MAAPEQQNKRHPTPKGARRRSRYHPNSAHEHILKGSVFSTISVLRVNLVHRSGVTSGRRLGLRTINASA